jgi:hypothetical protein
MHADVQPLTGRPLPGRRPAGGFGLSLLGFIGVTSAAVAGLLMWALLTAPAQVSMAVAKGPSALAGVLVQVVFAAVERLLSWL